MPKVTKQSVRKRTVKKSSKSAIDRIKPIGFDADDGIRMNLWGRSGTGKTTLWATFPKPILALVCSGGSKPGELRSIDTPAYRKTIKQVTIDSTEDLGELVEHQQASETYTTIVLDHVTGLQNLVMKEILNLGEQPVALYRRAGKGESWGIASKQDYGQAVIRMKELLRVLLSLDCNVIIVGQEREFNVEEEGELLMPFVGCSVFPKVAEWLSPACDYICQTFIRQRTTTKSVTVGKKSIATKVKAKGVDYCLRTGPDATYTTKFRLPRGSKLPDVLIDPTYTKILKLIKQGG